MTRTAAMLLVFSIVTAPIGAEQAKVLINGVPLACAEAVRFRDGELFVQFSRLIDRWDDKQADRYDAEIKQFNAYLQKAREALKTATSAATKKIVASVVALGLGLASQGLGRSYELHAKTLGLSAVDLQAAKMATDRGAAMVDMVTSTALGAGPDIVGVLKSFPLPIVVALTVASPWATVTLGTASVLSDVSAVVLAVWEKQLAVGDATTQINVLEGGLRELIAKSPRAKLQGLLTMKASIDSSCGGR